MMGTRLLSSSFRPPEALPSFPTRRSSDLCRSRCNRGTHHRRQSVVFHYPEPSGIHRHFVASDTRSEEHTSELQSRGHLVCRLLLEEKKIESDPIPAPLQSLDLGCAHV